MAWSCSQCGHELDWYAPTCGHCKRMRAGAKALFVLAFLAILSIAFLS